MNNTYNIKKREVKVENKKGISIKELILIGILLAAGAVLKFLVGSFINIAGVKPNFIIAMYCLAILLIRPKIYEGAIIGLIAGAVCQFFPGTPYLNFISELAGAVVMTALIKVPIKIGKVDFSPAFSTFVSTVISGGIFVSCLLLLIGAVNTSLIAYIPVVLGTALINTVMVAILNVPLKLAFKAGLK